MRISKCSANNAKTALSYCKTWHFFDASIAPVGRLATRIATLLLGKHKPIFHPVSDCGDHVIVKNAKNLILTGKKMENKEWISHTGYPGGLRITKIAKLMETDPSQVIIRAVKGMLPKNKLRQVRLDRLRVFSEDGPTSYDVNAHKDYRNHNKII